MVALVVAVRVGFAQGLDYRLLLELTTPLLLAQAALQIPTDQILYLALSLAQAAGEAVKMLIQMDQAVDRVVVVEK